LANSFKAIRNYSKAADLYTMIIKKEPKNLKALNNFANLKVNLNDLDGAINFYLRALEVSPKETNILFSLATSYQAIGNFEKAKEVAYKILKIDPKKTSAHKLISALSTYKERNEEKLRVMEKLSQEDLSENQKIDLFYALGKAYEDLKDYKRSFECLEKANFIKRKTVKYEIKNEEKVFNNIIKAFDQIDLNEFKKIPNQKRIIFICGMPRSGTTLTEQIIAAHNKVNGAGELIYLQNVIKHNFFDDLNLKKQKIIEEGLKKENIIEEEYLKSLDLHSFNTKIITDKAPPNFRWIGFMKIFFPNCKIIHCSRDAKDNCLSIFKNAFGSKDMDWSHSQKDIGGYYNLYLKLMNYWKGKLPELIYEAKYENIVSNPGDEIKKLINFCDLEWDSDCLNFYKKKKTSIQTVSASQARKPIYSSSVNSSSEYSEYLKEMYDILDTH
jgi:tetratricopeptide (TPR) repeat protein